MAMIAARQVEALDAERAVRVTWADGHVSEIANDALRDACPCARCRDAREGGRRMLRMAAATKLAGWKRIGNYALSFEWADGHTEGIFAYDFLRGLCPCEDCAPTTTG